MLTVQDVTAGYTNVPVLREVSLTIERGDLVTMVGPNGAGKTTLFRTITGFLTPSGGTIRYRDESIVGRAPYELVRRGVGQVAEGHQIFGEQSVLDNLRLARHYGGADSERTWELERIYELFPVLKDRQQQLAGTLSGGEQQMLAISLALVTGPQLLLLDEPSLGLAPMIVETIFETIERLNEEAITVFLIEQNARAALRVADRGYVMENGRIVLEDAADRLLQDEHVRSHYLGVGDASGG